MKNYPLRLATILISFLFVACSAVPADEANSSDAPTTTDTVEPSLELTTSPLDSDYPDTWEDKMSGQTYDEMLQANREKIFEVMLEQGADAEFPWDPKLEDFPIIEVVDGRDSVRVQVECMEEKGFGATAYANGTYLYDRVPQEQAMAHTIAHYSCVLQYPVDPMQYGTLPRQEIIKLYDYYTGTLISCLEGIGLTVDEPPTQEKWVDDYVTGKRLWDPYAAYWRQNNGDNFDTVDEVYGTCPQYPEDFWPN